MASALAAEKGSPDIALLSDYEHVCRWFGPMPFAEFAAGYLAMEAWCADRDLSRAMLGGRCAERAMCGEVWPSC